MKQQGDRIQRINALLEVKQYAHARTELTSYIAEEPDNATWWSLLAWTEYYADENQQALSAIDQALKAGDRSAASWVCRANILVSLNRQRAAVDSAQRALDLEPNNVSAHLIMARALADIEFFGFRAVRHAKKARELAPENPATHAAVGLVSVRKKMPGANWLANRSLRTATRLDPANFHTKHTVGEAALDRYRFHRAMRIFAELLSREPDSRSAAHNFTLASRRHWTRLRWILCGVWVPAFVGALVAYSTEDADAPTWPRILIRAVTTVVVLGAVTVFVFCTLWSFPRSVRPSVVLQLKSDRYTKVMMIGQAWVIACCLVMVNVPWWDDYMISVCTFAAFLGYGLCYAVVKIRPRFLWPEKAD